MHTDPKSMSYLNLKVETECLLEMCGLDWRSPMVTNYCKNLTRKYGGRVIKPQCMPVGDMRRLKQQLEKRIFGLKEVA